MSKVDVDGDWPDPDTGGQPATAQHLENHTRRLPKSAAERSQGPKTRAANKERMKGSRRFDPR